MESNGKNGASANGNSCIAISGSVAGDVTLHQYLIPAYNSQGEQIERLIMAIDALVARLDRLEVSRLEREAARHEKRPIPEA